MRTKALISSASLLCLLVVGGTPAASLANQSTDRTPKRIPQFEALVDAYQRDYPTLTDDQALRAAAGQEHRIRLLERLQAKDQAGFGGSWYDPLSDTQHINTVGVAAASAARELGAVGGLKIVTHQVAHSLTTLRVTAADINAGRHQVLGSAAVDAAVPDVLTNKVIVTISAADLERLRKTRAVLSSAIVLKQGEVVPSVPDVCVSRFSCTTPLRGGIVLWATQAGNNQCSLGFTARAGDGSRWAVTAGHCGNITGEFGIWGHGGSVIGPVQAGRNSGEIDIARIQVTNPAWQTGGYLYDFFQPNVPAAVHYSITARGTIQAGDGVCLSAWHSTAANCGTIVTAFGPRLMPQVTFDACGGDSGGGWFHITSYGENWAYGIHRGQAGNPNNNTCHDHAANDSIFTAVPDMNAWWDATTASLLRIEER